MGNSIFTISSNAFKALQVAQSAMKGLDPAHIAPLSEDQNSQVTKAFYLLNQAQTSFTQYGTNWFTRTIRRIFFGSLINKINSQMAKILPFMNFVQVYNREADQLSNRLKEVLAVCPEDRKSEFGKKLDQYMESYLTISRNFTKEMILLNGALASGTINQEQFEGQVAEIRNKQQYVASSANLQTALDALLAEYVPNTRIDLTQL